MLAYFGHPKCASRWTLAVLRSICHDLRLRFDLVERDANSPETLNALARERGTGVLADSVSTPERARDLDFERGFHVIRDPRDIVVSTYFSHLYSHPTAAFPRVAEQRRRLETLPKSDGLSYLIEARGPQFEAMRSWDYGQENVLEVRFEDIARNPYGSMLRVADFLGLLDDRELNGPRSLAAGLMAALRSVESRVLPSCRLLPAPRRLTVERLARIVYHHDFTRKSGGREVGDEDPRSHYRKGVPGDWRNHLEPRHLDRMHELYGDLVGALGYDTAR